MPAQNHQSQYFIFTKQQATNFLSEIEIKRINKVLPKIDFIDKNGKEITNKKERYKCYARSINFLKFPEQDYYFRRKELLYDMSIVKTIDDYPYDGIKNFMSEFFSEYDFENPENNNGLLDIGKIIMATKGELRELKKNYGKITYTDKENKNTESVFDRSPHDEELEKHDWALYSYGEKVVSHQVGDGSTRIYYVKERPVEFKNQKITLKNTDSAKIILRDDIDNRNGVILTESNLIYEGDYHFLERKSSITQKSKPILYIETDALKDDYNRNFRLILAFGEKIEEIGLGTFSLIKDFGSLLAGAALLVKKEKGYYEKNKCKFYTSFKDESKTIPRAIRILLERRSRAYVKLPKELNHYTLKNLETYLISQKHNERKNYDSREIIIHRKDAFVSIPLNCNGAENTNKFNAILKKTVSILKEQPYNLREITYGTIKHQENENGVENPSIKSRKSNQILLESPGSREEYESNFDKMIQSNLMIFVLPVILFPYELTIEDLKKIKKDNNVDKNLKKIQTENVHNISTAFMEMGFAIGLRKKILILTSEKVAKTFPSIIKKFAKSEEQQYVKIITCEVDTETSLSTSFKKHEKDILKFLDAHLDFEIIEE